VEEDVRKVKIMDKDIGRVRIINPASGDILEGKARHTTESSMSSNGQAVFVISLDNGEVLTLRENETGLYHMQRINDWLGRR
jgi:hypothetical protein